MLIHASLPAREPGPAAAAIARMWNGTAMPFPPVPGAWIVFAGDERGTQLEIYPAEVALVPGPAEVAGAAADASAATGVHIAIAVPHEAETIIAMAAGLGWTARVCNRGGLFDVVEVWVDDRFMIEALTPAMQRDYVAAMTPANWRQAFGLPEAA
ncbi:hypothetical protein STAQ_48720 [Allostella sp. ATCC 35155]|nr:hypothetical protein STAQ_48720 [Stella sp. ATCC 35155]